MTISEIALLINAIYADVGIKYKDIFQNIVVGCHCTPPTEWLGDTALAFKAVLDDNAITNLELKEDSYHGRIVGLCSFAF